MGVPTLFAVQAYNGQSTMHPTPDYAPTYIIPYSQVVPKFQRSV